MSFDGLESRRIKRNNNYAVYNVRKVNMLHIRGVYGMYGRYLGMKNAQDSVVMKGGFVYY